MSWEPVEPTDERAHPPDEEILHASPRRVSRVERWFAAAAGRRLGRRGWAVVVAVVVLLAAGGVLVQRAHQRSVRSAAATAREVAVVRGWVSGSSSGDVTNVASSGGLGDCATVNPDHPPQARLLLELLAALPGYVVRSTVRTIDQFGQLCLTQVSVRNSAGTVVVLRAQPPGQSGLALPARTSKTGTSERGGGSVGYVATGTADRWTVAAGWVATHGNPPDEDVLKHLVALEVPRW